MFDNWKTTWHLIKKVERLETLLLMLATEVAHDHVISSGTKLVAREVVEELSDEV